LVGLVNVFVGARSLTVKKFETVLGLTSAVLATIGLRRPSPARRLAAFAFEPNPRMFGSEDRH
jgi:hypothetical protein